MKITLALALLALSALFTAECKVVQKKHHNDDHHEEDEQDLHDSLASVLESFEIPDNNVEIVQKKHHTDDHHEEHEEEDVIDSMASVLESFEIPDNTEVQKRDRSDDNTRSQDDDTFDSSDGSEDRYGKPTVKSVLKKNHRDDDVVAQHATDSEEFEIVKAQCERALARSCDLDELVLLAAQLERFQDNPTSSEARDIVAQHGGLATFCRKATTLLKCILDVADGSECRYYREHDEVEANINDIRTGYNEIKENCPGNVKKVRLIAERFLKQFK